MFKYKRKDSSNIEIKISNIFEIYGEIDIGFQNHIIIDLEKIINYMSDDINIDEKTTNYNNKKNRCWNIIERKNL